MNERLQQIESAQYYSPERRMYDFRPRKYAIFDMDGTIFDTSEIFLKSHRKLANEINGFDYKLKHQQALVSTKRSPGQTSISVFLDIIKANLEYSDLLNEELQDRRSEIFNSYLTGGLPIHIVKPGVSSIINYVKEKGIKPVLATASKKDQVDLLFSSQTIIAADDFLSIITSDEDPSYSVTRDKSRILSIAIESISANEGRRISSNECMSFDDSPHGVNAARCVGIGLNIAIPDQYSIEAAIGESFEFGKADLVAQDFDYLIAIWKTAEVV